MENKTHFEIAKLCCEIANVNSYRKQIILESAMQPDDDSKYINSVLFSLFNKNKKIENLAIQYDTEIEPFIHDHRNVPYACIFFAKLSNELVDNVKLSCQTFSWAIHYFVDCATPIHESSIRSLWDYLNGKHQMYENYVDKYYSKHFQETCKQGLSIGMKEGLNFTLSSAKALASKSASFYDNISMSIDNKNYQKLHDTTHNVFLNLGENLARFIKTFRNS